MNNTIDFENLEDRRAKRREQKKRPRMRVHGKALKKSSARGVMRIVKVERKKKG